MGSRDRKPRNFSPPQAGRMPHYRGGRASVERSAPVHGGHTHRLPCDLESQPFRAKEDLRHECISQYIGCCNKRVL